MLDIKFIAENTEDVKANLSKRNFDTSVIDSVVELNNERKKLTGEVESNRAEVKKISQQVGMKKKAGEDATDLMNKVAELKKKSSDMETALEEIQVKQRDILSTIPNLISDNVPVGATEDENIEFKRIGDPINFSFKVKDHVALGEELGMLDFDKAAQITGARFVLYKKALARLERALMNYMLDFHHDRGFEEIIPPFIVNEKSLYGTGQLPKFKEDLFKLEGTDWYLIPTSEVPLTNIKRDEIFNHSELPLRYTSCTPCFRSEAGSHGKDTRGLIRLHQFNKVEMVCIVAANDSERAHKEMIDSACGILEELGLPYKAVTLCTGDIGFGARETVDLEVWVPSQEKYREISSISNCWDFQARRAGIRYKTNEPKAKPQFAHTLNGSGLAVGRTLVAIMENYQNEDGSITIPEKIRPYMGGLERISK
jgi:seryl-tRNA synthetase